MSPVRRFLRGFQLFRGESHRTGEARQLAGEPTSARRFVPAAELPGDELPDAPLRSPVLQPSTQTLASARSTANP